LAKASEGDPPPKSIAYILMILRTPKRSYSLGLHVYTHTVRKISGFAP
jgi:hypothetical protein